MQGKEEEFRLPSIVGAGTNQGGAGKGALKPPRPMQRTQTSDNIHKEYGKVPKYIKEFKAEKEELER